MLRSRGARQESLDRRVAHLPCLSDSCCKFHLIKLKGPGTAVMTHVVLMYFVYIYMDYLYVLFICITVLRIISYNTLCVYLSYVWIWIRIPISSIVRTVVGTRGGQVDGQPGQQGRQQQVQHHQVAVAPAAEQVLVVQVAALTVALCVRNHIIFGDDRH